MPDYGLDFAIPFTGDPDSTLPYADDDDALLVPGSLALFEPNHSANPITGVPAVNDDVPNIAWKRLRDLVGSGDASTLAFKRGGVADAAGALVTERSGKGGLHSIISQTNNTVNNQALTIELKTAPLARISANPDNRYYFSVWERITRVAVTGAPDQAIIGVNTSNGIINLMALVANTGAVPPFGGVMLGPTNDPTSPNTAGNRFRSIGSTGKSGTPSSGWTGIMFGTGLIGVYGNAGTYGNKSASRLVYRAYLEDLTVSGRTYAQVQALDYALWQAAMGTGGRYAGDTFTTPAI